MVSIMSVVRAMVPFVILSSVTSREVPVLAVLPVRQRASSSAHLSRMESEPFPVQDMMLPLGSLYTRVALHCLRKAFSGDQKLRSSSQSTASAAPVSALGRNIRPVRSNFPFQVLALSTSGDNRGTPTKKHWTFKPKAVVGVAIGAPFLMFGVFASWICVKFRHRANRNGSPGLPRRVHREYNTTNSGKSKKFKRSWLGSFSFTSFASTPKRRVNLSSACEMKYSVLQAATDNFSTSNLLGEGASSRVYRAKLDDGTIAAVKQSQRDTECRHAVLQFQSEVNLMRQVRHPNLVSLLGFCRHDEQRLLIIEHMENGSLADQLHGPTKGIGLSWNFRVKIALESARGLEYLHEHCVPPVVHQNFKACNILLDANYNVKISDFGSAKLLDSLSHEEILQHEGNISYIAPEFFESGTLTEKSNVYAFGVVLLELLTGRKPIDDSLPFEQQSLVDWAKPQLTDRKKLPTLVAQSLRADLNLKHLYQVAAVAALCVCDEPSYRPLIADVVQSLVPLVTIELGGALRPTSNPSTNRLKAKSQSFKTSVDEAV